MSAVITLPCCLKGCDRLVQVQLKEWALPSNSFVLCNDCEDKVVINVVVEVEASGTFSPNFSLNFARAMAAWRRLRKGVTLPHRPFTTSLTNRRKSVLDISSG
jgi:hypothetical protein